jgi:hypothetical protein
MFFARALPGKIFPSSYIINIISIFIYYFVLAFVMVFFNAVYNDFYLKYYFQEKWGFKTSFKFISSKYVTLLAASTLCLLMIAGGFVFFIIGSMVFGTFLSFVYPAIIFEGKKTGQSISRSFKLASYNFWGLLGTYCLYFLIILVSLLFVAGILSIPIIVFYINNSVLFKNILSSSNSFFIIIIVIVYFILYFVYLLIVTSLTTSLNVILFFNQKVKHEQFGIEAMVESITLENIAGKT